MDVANERVLAVQPEDLGRIFVERADAGDMDGLVALDRTRRDAGVAERQDRSQCRRDPVDLPAAARHQAGL